MNKSLGGHAFGWRTAIAAIAGVSLMAFPSAVDAAGSGSFITVAKGLPNPPANDAAAAALPGNRVLVAGGYGIVSPYLGTYAAGGAEILNARGVVVGNLTMEHRRSGPAAAPLPDGRVLIAGGYEGGTGRVPPGPVLANSEIYDPRTNSLSPGPSLQTPREGAAAVALNDGRILVIGGVEDHSAFPSVLASVEVLEPGAEAFAPAGTIDAPRVFAAAAPLPDGRVLVVGGGYAGSEIYDPARGTSTPGPAFPAAPTGSAAAPLPDGRVLLMGGGEAGMGSREASVYDPRLGGFSSKGIGHMHVGRGHSAAAALEDGRVLVTGGEGGLSNPSVEVFAATNRFKARLAGSRLVVKVRASGKVKVRGSGRSLSSTAGGSAGSNGLRIRRSSRGGGPGKIRVPLRLSKRGKRLLAHGRLGVKLRITFKPEGGLARTKIQRLPPTH